MKRDIRTVVTLGIAVLFSACMLLGQSYDKLGNWQMIFGSLERFIISSIKFVCIIVLSFKLLNYLYDYLEKNNKFQIKSHLFERIVFEKYPMLCPWIIIAVMWLPNYLLFSPGCMTADAMKQLNQFFSGQITNHHPIFTTLLQGFFVFLGRKIGNMEIGVALYLMIVLLVSTGALAKGFVWMSQRKIKYGIRWISLLFFCFFPIWSAYARTMVKDNLYYPIFYIFVLYVFDMMIEGDEFFKQRKKIIQVLLVGIVLCLVRHNGIYVVLGTFLGITIFRKGYRKICLILFLIMCIFWKGYNGIITTCGVEPGGKQEMLSIPFQQTARYLKYYKKDVTTEEKKAIEHVLDYENISKNYNPDLSDPVKDTYKKNDQYLGEYFKVWGSQFLKHPTVYLQATFNGTYGYYAYKKNIKHPYGYYDQPKCIVPYQKEYSIKFNSIFKNLRDIYKKILDNLLKIKIIKIFSQPMLYNWCYIILIGFFLQNNRLRKDWVIFIPFIISFLLCIASPVNADMRYMLPLLSTCNLYIAFTQMKILN